MVDRSPFVFHVGRGLEERIALRERVLRGPPDGKLPHIGPSHSPGTSWRRLFAPSRTLKPSDVFLKYLLHENLHLDATIFDAHPEYRLRVYPISLSIHLPDGDVHTETVPMNLSLPERSVSNQRHVNQIAPIMQRGNSSEREKGKTKCCARRTIRPTTNSPFASSTNLAPHLCSQASPLAVPSHPSPYSYFMFRLISSSPTNTPERSSSSSLVLPYPPDHFRGVSPRYLLASLLFFSLLILLLHIANPPTPPLLYSLPFPTSPQITFAPQKKKKTGAPSSLTHRLPVFDIHIGSRPSLS
ncbi:uncharacterized protein CLUP02_05735 [Colletotrichum lupini]|uniref:Uncharacterized protein n=1 Tax=Colletotrichum lupini TaxID=145971 RepID=A0A9Q8SNB5_9PEZI|nr:uncharacterized protein CLUP02_05735 [Colletotrichum lupini]UQC80253.1 hypothetical protein CLUP02_05735 [Colletotrichum lupini]